MRPQELGVIVDDGSGFFRAAFSEYGLSFWRLYCYYWGTCRSPMSLPVEIAVTAALAALFW